MTNLSIPDCPKLIAEIALNRTKFRAGSGYILTSLISGKHLRISEQAYHIASKLDGKNKASDLIKADIGLTEAGITEVLTTLAAHGFIQGCLPQGTAKQKTANKTIENRAMSSRYKLFDASRILATIDPYIRWLFSGFGFFASLILLTIALWILVQNSNPTKSIVQWLFQLTIIDGIFFSLLIFAAKIVHELGHAIALQSMAHKEGIDPGPISIGVTRFFFLLMPYTDASATWRISSQKRRAIVALGGIYMEILLASLAIILTTQISNEVFKAILYQFAFISGISTLFFNLNPFIKLDGYHIVSDLFNIQNLQPRSSREIGKFFQRIFFLTPTSDHLNRVYVLYGIGSIFFRYLIFTGIAIAGWVMYPPLAIIVAVIGCSVLLIRPIINFLKDNSDHPVHPRGIVAATMICLVPILPVRETITISGLVENPTLQNIVLPEGTILKLEPTTSKTTNNIDFVNPSLNHKINISKLRLSVARLQYQIAVAERSPQFMQLKEVVETAKQRLALFEEDRKQLNLKQDFLNVIFKPSMSFMNLQSVKGNTSVGVFMDREDAHIKLLVPETELKHFANDGKIYLVKYWIGNAVHPQKTTLESPTWNLVQSLPSAVLTRKYGGQITVDPNGFEELVPAHTHFSTILNFTSSHKYKTTYAHGESVTASISTGWTILAKSIWDNLTNSLSARIQDLKK